MLIMNNLKRGFIDSNKCIGFSAMDMAVLAITEIQNNQQANFIKIGFYDNKEQCKFALGLLFEAMKANDTYFEFPHVRDLQEMMDIAHQHRSKVTNRKVGHGGS